MKGTRTRQKRSGGGRGRTGVVGAMAYLDSPHTPGSVSHTRRPGPAAGKSDRGGARRWAEIRPFAESLVGAKARQIIGKAGLRRSDLEDIRQQLLLYVVEHLAEYDRRRGTPEAHVTMLITTAVAMLLLTCPPNPDPAPMRVPRAAGCGQETLDEANKAHGRTDCLEAS